MLDTTETRSNMIVAGTLTTMASLSALLINRTNNYRVLDRILEKGDASQEISLDAALWLVSGTEEANPNVTAGYQGLCE